MRIGRHGSNHKVPLATLLTLILYPHTLSWQKTCLWMTTGTSEFNLEAWKSVWSHTLSDYMCDHSH